MVRYRKAGSDAPTLDTWTWQPTAARTDRVERLHDRIRLVELATGRRSERVEGTRYERHWARGFGAWASRDVVVRSAADAEGLVITDLRTGIAVHGADPNVRDRRLAVDGDRRLASAGINAGVTVIDVETGRVLMRDDTVRLVRSSPYPPTPIPS